MTPDCSPWHSDFFACRQCEPLIDADERRSMTDSRRPDSPLFRDHPTSCTGSCCWDPRDAA